MRELGKYGISYLKYIETPCFSYWEEYFLQTPILEGDVYFQGRLAFPVTGGEKKTIKDPKKIQKGLLDI